MMDPSDGYRYIYIYIHGVISRRDGLIILNATRSIAGSLISND